jgi:hypothetical protein
MSAVQSWKFSLVAPPGINHRPYSVFAIHKWSSKLVRIVLSTVWVWYSTVVATTNSPGNLLEILNSEFHKLYFFFDLTCSRSTQLNQDSFLSQTGSWWLEWIFLFTLISTTSMMPLTIRLFPESNESVNAIKYLEVFSYLKLNFKFYIRQLSNKLSRTLFSIKSAPKSIFYFSSVQYLGVTAGIEPTT